MTIIEYLNLFRVILDWQEKGKKYMSMEKFISNIFNLKQHHADFDLNIFWL